MNPKPLYTLSRDGVPEVQVFGEIGISDGSEAVFRSSDVQSRYPARSLLKPFQFLATRILEGSSLSDWHVAALGSISATKEQRVELEKWTSGGELPSLVAMLKNLGMDSSHSCFSKHLAILQSCKKQGWGIENYRSVDHPFHKNLIKILSELLGEHEDSFQCVTDGCKLPTPVLWLDQIAVLFQILASGAGQEQILMIRDLMLKDPDWIGGPERIDSRLMKENSNLLIAKEGADGLLAVGVLPNSRFKNGLGMIVKLAGGYQPTSAALALKPFFADMGFRCPVSVPEGQSIEYHFKPWEKLGKTWFDISPQLKGETAVWPGDEPFSRKIAFDTEAGDHLSLSSIKTTLHIGSHADSPLHFDRSRKGIDQVDVWKYEGACQVIEVKIERHQEIKVEDIKGIKIIAPRVLFKTLSFPDFTKFNTDFNALSPELIEYLAGKRVVLIGIDTPSIDLFESKRLDSHKATLRTEMAILEGIDLQEISAGIYELSAIPLRIEGGDASPVRALLRPVKPPSGS